jgi:uncharacterized membrane protein YobD (UPF0266 family)
MQGSLADRGSSNCQLMGVLSAKACALLSASPSVGALIMSVTLCVISLVNVILNFFMCSALVYKTEGFHGLSEFL